MIGATDLSTGADFDFSSEQLGRLCSSIDRVQLAFAVAASSAVPLLFSHLTLHSHRGLCAERGEAAVEQDGQSVPRRIVFIAVNSEREIDLAMDTSDEVPAPFAVLDALIHAGLGRSSKETSLVFSDAVAQWRLGSRASHVGRRPSRGMSGFSKTSARGAPTLRP